MYTNLILYRNELKNKTVPRYKIIGIITELLFSKELFSKNADITKFLKDVFDIEYKFYIMKSRTLIVARLSKMIISLDNDATYKKKLLMFINEKIEILKNIEDVKDKKNEFDGWINHE